MGWNFASAVSSFCEAHVIVYDGYRDRLKDYCEAHPEETRNLHFHYLPTKAARGRCTAWIGRMFPTLYYYYNYRKWLFQASILAQELDIEHHFDIIHQVTLAGFRFPGYLWRLHKPLLWGPCGGLDNAPGKLLLSLRLMDIIGYTLRNVINAWQKRFGYAAKFYAQRADYILASTGEGERVIRQIWKRPGEYMCEIGCQDERQGEEKPSTHTPNTPLRVCWVGIMNNQRKNLPLLFKALEYCDSPVEVYVMGDGVLKKRWEKLASRIPAQHRVKFLGSVPQKEVFSEMRKSHVFCITSVKDDTSSVLLEALQHGLPVIAPNSCGFSGVITEQCGIKIDNDWPKVFAARYGQALNELAQDEIKRLNLANGAILRAKEFSWAHKTARLQMIYSALIAGRHP